MKKKFSKPLVRYDSIRISKSGLFIVVDCGNFIVILPVAELSALQTARAA